MCTCDLVWIKSTHLGFPKLFTAHAPGFFKALWHADLKDDMWQFVAPHVVRVRGAVPCMHADLDLKPLRSNPTRALNSSVHGLDRRMFGMKGSTAVVLTVCVLMVAGVVLGQAAPGNFNDHC
jgi:hypothetical protein